MTIWWTSFLPLFLLLMILSYQKKETEQAVASQIKRKKGDREMQEIARRYIGKDVLLNTVSSGSCDGVIKEVVENAVVLEKNGSETVVNLDYVIRLREYPRNKKGKRKSVVAD